MISRHCNALYTVQNVVGETLKMSESSPASSFGRLERQNVWEHSDSESEESHQAPPAIPMYLRNLFTCVAPDANLDLTNESEVTRFIDKYHTNRHHTELVNRVVSLMQIQNVLKVSAVFDAVEVRLVTHAVDEMLRHLPAPERDAIVTLARQERKKQILAELVDSSLLDPSSHLFTSLIRCQL